MTNQAANNDLKNSIGMLRIDLQDSMRQSSLDPKAMSPFQRILLTTDGTVTDILEAQMSESMKVVKLYEEVIPANKTIPYLEIGEGTEVIARKILLRGKCSHKNYIYAESVLVPERLSPAMREALLTTRKPIGLLILESRTESFREILSCKREPMGEIAQYYDLPEDAPLISRTYRIYAGGHPIMLITEKFPESYFKD